MVQDLVQAKLESSYFTMLTLPSHTHTDPFIHTFLWTGSQTLLQIGITWGSSKPLMPGFHTRYSDLIATGCHLDIKSFKTSLSHPSVQQSLKLEGCIIWCWLWCSPSWAMEVWETVFKQKIKWEKMIFSH